MRSHINEDFENNCVPGTCVWCKAESPGYRCSLLTQGSSINRVHFFCDRKCYQLDRVHRGYARTQPEPEQDQEAKV
jgi:hypothetical protein